RSATADSRNALVGLDHVSGATKQEHLAAIGDDEQCFEVAEHLVGTPVLGQLDRCPSEIAVVLLELGFKAGEEIKGVSGRSGKASEDLVLVKAANLAGRVLDHAFAESDLPVGGHDDATVPVDAQDSGGTNTRFVFLSLSVAA